MYYMVKELCGDYGYVKVFIKSKKRVRVSDTIRALTAHKTYATARVYTVLHVNKCVNEKLHEVLGKWLSEQEFKKLLVDIVTSCYKRGKTIEKYLKRVREFIEEFTKSPLPELKRGPVILVNSASFIRRLAKRRICLPSYPFYDIYVFKRTFHIHDKSSDMAVILPMRREELDKYLDAINEENASKVEKIVSGALRGISIMEEMGWKCEGSEIVDVLRTTLAYCKILAHD